jgi:hypothetical protein
MVGKEGPNTQSLTGKELHTYCIYICLLIITFPPNLLLIISFVHSGNWKFENKARYAYQTCDENNAFENTFNVNCDDEDTNFEQIIYNEDEESQDEELEVLGIVPHFLKKGIDSSKDNEWYINV